MTRVSGSTNGRGGDGAIADPPAVATRGAAALATDEPGDFGWGSAQRWAGELVDALAGEVVLRHATGRTVLDLGHGAPRVADWVRPRAASLRVVDAIDLGRGATIRLPLRDASFEVVYSLRTLPHLGHDDDSSESAARSLLHEVARILVPGGTALCQIANPRSLWGLYHGVRHPVTVIERGSLVLESPRGLTRFDTLARFAKLLPPSLTLTQLHGLRVFVILPQLLALPVVGRLLAKLDWYARDRAPWRRFGTHLLVVLRRSHAALAEPSG